MLLLLLAVMIQWSGANFALPHTFKPAIILGVLGPSSEFGSESKSLSDFDALSEASSYSEAESESLSESESESEAESFSSNVHESIARQQPKPILSEAEISKKSALHTKFSISNKLLKKRGKRGRYSLPYLLKIFLSPKMLVSLTKGYWKSLIDPDYPPVGDGGASQLRSALAAKAGSRGSSRGRKNSKSSGGVMSKTLSDLPPINS